MWVHGHKEHKDLLLWLQLPPSGSACQQLPPPSLPASPQRRRQITSWCDGWNSAGLAETPPHFEKHCSTASVMRKAKRGRAYVAPVLGFLCPIKDWVPCIWIFSSRQLMKRALQSLVSKTGRQFCTWVSLLTCVFGVLSAHSETHWLKETMVSVTVLWQNEDWRERLF